MIVLAVDPGLGKCGVAVCGPGAVLARAIVPPADLGALVRRWVVEHHVQTVLVGGATGSRNVLKTLEAAAGDLSVPVMAVDERATTLAARLRYFRDNPPRGWRRFVPKTFQLPPKPYDDYAAVVMAERFLSACRPDSSTVREPDIR